MIQVILKNFASTNTEHRAFATEVAELLTTIVNAAEFFRKVKTAHYSHTVRTNNDGIQRLSSDQIAEVISNGLERDTNADTTIDLQIVLEEMRDRTLGYVTPPHHVIHTNSNWFEDRMNADDPLSMAAHWMHEWMHAAGFYHPRRRAHLDVPYQIGEFVVQVGREFTSTGTMKSKTASDRGMDYLVASRETPCTVSSDDTADPDESY